MKNWKIVLCAMMLMFAIGNLTGIGKITNLVAVNSEPKVELSIQTEMDKDSNTTVLATLTSPVIVTFIDLEEVTVEKTVSANKKHIKRKVPQPEEDDPMHILHGKPYFNVKCTMADIHMKFRSHIESNQLI